MALTLEDCDRMIEAADRAGVVLIVGHTANFNPGVQKMRQLVTGELGTLALITANAYTDFLYRPRRPEALVTEQGGGIMYNQVPHQVDAVRFLAGGVARTVRASTWSLDPARPTEGCYAAFLTFDGGAVASLVYSGYDHLDSSELAAGASAPNGGYGPPGVRSRRCTPHRRRWSSVSRAATRAADRARTTANLCHSCSLNWGISWLLARTRTCAWFQRVWRSTPARDSR